MSRKQPKELRIESILMAAVEEFLEKGYTGASVDAIARRAGISKGGFYHHFPNKEVLLMEANRKLSEPIMEIVKKAISNESALDGLAFYIEEYIKYWFKRPRELSFLFLSMSKAFESPILMDYYKEYAEYSTAFFVRMFEKAVQLGEADITDIEAAGISLMGALDGVLTYAIIHSDIEIETLVQRFRLIWLPEKK